MEVKILAEKLEAHKKSNNKDHASIFDLCRSLDRKIGTIKDNHLEHLERDVSTLKTDLKWIKGIGMFIIGETLVVLYKLFL